MRDYHSTWAVIRGIGVFLRTVGGGDFEMSASEIEAAPSPNGAPINLVYAEKES